MPTKISKILQALEPSATLAMAAKAKELKAAGRTVYDLSVGEPDFNTPEHICQAAVAAMKAGHTHYTVASGIPELKKAVVEQYKAVHGLEYAPAPGGDRQRGETRAAQRVHGDFGSRRRGDHSRPVLGQLCRAGEADRGQAGDRRDRAGEQLQAHARAASGGVHAEDASAAAVQPVESDRQHVLARRIGRVGRRGDRKGSARHGRRNLRAAGLWRQQVRQLRHRAAGLAGADDAHQRREQDLRHDRLADRLEHFAAEHRQGDRRLAEPGDLEPVQHQPVRRRWPRCNGPQDCVDKMLAEFAKRREFVSQRIAEIPGLSCAEIAGAFYAFINIKKHLGRKYSGVQVDNSTQWCLELLDKKGVATVMGSAFGAEGYARLSFATSMANLEAALKAIEEFVK